MFTIHTYLMTNKFVNYQDISEINQNVRRLSIRNIRHVFSISFIARFHNFYGTSNTAIAVGVKYNCRKTKHAEHGKMKNDISHNKYAARSCWTCYFSQLFYSRMSFNMCHVDFNDFHFSCKSDFISSSRKLSMTVTVEYYHLTRRHHLIITTQRISRRIKTFSGSCHYRLLLKKSLFSGLWYNQHLEYVFPQNCFFVVFSWNHVLMQFHEHKLSFY